MLEMVPFRSGKFWKNIPDDILLLRHMSNFTLSGYYPHIIITMDEHLTLTELRKILKESNAAKAFHSDEFKRRFQRGKIVNLIERHLKWRKQQGNSPE